VSHNHKRIAAGRINEHLGFEFMPGDDSGDCEWKMEFQIEAILMRNCGSIFVDTVLERINHRR